MSSRTFEEKQWVVNRIETLIDISKKDIKFRSESLSEIQKTITDGFAKTRNTLLTIIGITISTIFGLSFLEILDSNISGWLILIIAIVAVVLFLSVNFAQKLIQKGLAPLQMALLKSNDQYNRVNARVIDETIDLNKINYEKLEAFYHYVYLTFGVTLIMILNSANDGKEKSYNIKYLRPVFIQVIDEMTKSLVVFEKMYYDYEVQLKDNGFLTGVYLEILKPVVDHIKSQKDIHEKT